MQTRITSRSASLGRPKAPPGLPPGWQGAPDPPCAQARMARIAREHEARLARNMISNHMFRATITDMQDKYCGNCCNIYLIQSQHKGIHKRGGAVEGRATSFVVAAAGRHLCILALNKVNIVNIIAATTILVLHVGNGRSEHV